MKYYVRAHDDHYHVLEEEEQLPTLLDDRPLNPWLYFEKDLAENVALLLNNGVEPVRIKAMDAFEIREAAQLLVITSGRDERVSMTTQKEIDRAQKAKEIIERYNARLKELDFAYRREMLDLFGEPQPGLFDSERWWPYL